ncbi:low molecular weight phosphotyrosine protein phosphatase [Pseudomonas sp. CDFA 602]|uniref:low molecular weight protein-tyrosine-phosphatase n=1 Tax=Pseudomonas californiensis TaxID=2829823 RepID=UPI001E4CF241|nr:low molecular weight protein-tyrosine-phosphatase [Pseudomonas californiensis]MCD5992708.1 low molecular weight phosphotyrosine protein phosphatase [Pseudomonas californiensis]MCD5998588.1 low molecular weight phosphotyrosine protein phosphatase [Pseudomonas californiensis]
MFSNVLVVCVGNICRSPMAVAMLEQRLAAAEVRVRSAGIAALTGSTMDTLAKAVLQSHRVPVSRHEARQVTRLLLREADLILLMEHAHMLKILALAPEVRGKTFLIGKWQQPPEVADPYQRPKSAFEQTYQHLSRCVDDWLPHLQSGEQDK